MTNWLILITAIIYLTVGVECLLDKKFGLSMTYLGYAFAAVGLYIVGKG